MKGAVEVAIGFLIVMVISALVMIFMMGWLGGMFPELTEISQYATSQAEQQMMNEFAKAGDTILATIPTQNTFAPGSRIRFKVGVRKTAEVDDYDYFALCFGQMSKIICTTPTDSPVSITGDPSGIKFQFPAVTKITTRGDISLMSGIMEIPDTVTEGTYGFRIYVCEGSTGQFTCTGLANSYGAYDFIVEIQ